MFSVNDTIVAIATPPGRGGIGVVRISGAQSAAIAAILARHRAPLEPRHATFARFASHESRQVEGPLGDQVILTFFPAPHSYTGEDVVEVSGHGSPVLLRAIVESAMVAGARLAEPGEFTLRAFLNQRIDLVQAEAVRDLIDAVTPLQARAAYDQLEGTLTTQIARVDAQLFDLVVRLEASLDFPDAGYHFVESGDAAREIARVKEQLATLAGSATRGRLIREGLQVTLAGRPNAGKSSLFNCLAGQGRAIVTDTPGTTRDLVTETVDIDGIPMTLVDTAGVRAGAVDPIEVEGIARAVAVRDVADIVLVVVDRSRSLDADDRALLESTSHRRRVVVASKSDLAPAWPMDELPEASPLALSATSGEGVDCLRAALVVAAAGEPLRDVPAITNVRHQDLLTRAHAALERAEAAALGGAPEEFVLADLGDARSRLEEITGTRTSDDVLHAIFDRFCIGK